MAKGGLCSVGWAISYGSMMFYMSNPEVDVLRRVFPTALDTSPAPCDLPCSTSNCFWINRLSFKCPECSHKISQSSPRVLMSTEYCRSVTVSPRTPPASPISLLLRTKLSKFLSSETQISLSSMCERDKKILECWQHGCLELLETRICWCGMWHQCPREINSLTPKLFTEHGLLFQDFERRFTWSEESQHNMKPFLLYIVFVFSRRNSCDAASTWYLLLETWKKRRPKRNSCFTSAMIKHNWAHCTVHMGVPSTLQWATLMPQYDTHTEANCCYPEMLSKWLVAPHVRWASEDTHHWSSTLRQAARCTGYNDWSSSAALQDNVKKTEENQHVSRLRNA